MPFGKETSLAMRLTSPLGVTRKTPLILPANATPWAASTVAQTTRVPKT